MKKRVNITMKNFNLKAMLLLAVLLCSSVSAFANEEITQDNIKYTLFDDGTAAVSGAERSITTANIPEKITYEGKDHAVTSIRKYAFQDCTGLTSVDIPNSVTSIGGYAFLGCTGLTSVDIPGSVTIMGEYAFLGCSSLFAYHYKKDGTATLLKVGYKSAEISGKDTYNIPEKVTHEGKDYSVTGIGGRAFEGCTGLASVDIPGSVTSIGGYAFEGCTDLVSVNIPNSVTSIGYGAFGDCSSLFAYHYKKDGTATLLKAGYNSAEMSGRETYSIPEKVTHNGTEYSVTRIGEYAFYDCTGLAPASRNWYATPHRLLYARGVSFMALTRTNARSTFRRRALTPTSPPHSGRIFST